MRPSIAPPKNSRHLFFIAVALIFLGMAGPSKAGVSCKIAADTFNLTLPSAVYIPPEMATGSALTAWIKSQTIADFYQCDNSNDQDSHDAAGIVFSTGAGLLAKSTSAPFSSEGDTYTVYETGLAGVGLVVAVKQIIAGCSEFNRLDLNRSREGWRPCVPPEKGKFSLKGEVWARLVKTGPIAGGTMPQRVIAAASLVLASARGTPGVQPRPEIFFNLSSTTITAGTCSTAANTSVNMGNQRVQDLKYASSKSVDFNLTINCTPGVSKIRYQFDNRNHPTFTATPMQRISSAILIPLTSDSTAKGIFVFMTRRDNENIDYNQSYELNATNPSEAKSFQIPFLARFVKNGEGLAPGTAKAILHFTVSYE